MMDLSLSLSLSSALNPCPYVRETHDVMPSPWSTNIMWFLDPLFLDWFHFKNITYNKLINTSAQHVPCRMLIHLIYRPSNLHQAESHVSKLQPRLSCQIRRWNPRAPILSTLKIPLESWCCSFASSRSTSRRYIYICPYNTFVASVQSTGRPWKHIKTTCLTPPTISN